MTGPEGTDQACDLAKAFVEGVRPRGSLIEVKDGGQRGLIDGLAVGNRADHVAADPFLGTSDRLGIRRREQVVRQAPTTSKRLGRGKEPALEFSFRENDADGNVAPGLAGASRSLRPELRRTVVVAIDEHEDAPLRADLPCRELDGPLEFARPQELRSRDPQGTLNPNEEGRINPLHDASNQDRHGLDLAVSLDDAGDGQGRHQNPSFHAKEGVVRRS